MANYELPNNEMIESMLESNLDTIKPMKMKEMNKKLFPFWTPVSDDGSETYTDYDEYLSARDKAVKSMNKELSDKTGVVKAKDEMGKQTLVIPKGKTVEYDDNSITAVVSKALKDQTETKLKDNTGVVEPKSEDMPKGKTKQVTETDTASKVVVDSNAAKGKENNVGVVKPKAEMKTVVVDSLNKITSKTTELGTNIDASSKVVTSDKLATPKDGFSNPTGFVGAVKPAAVFTTNVTADKKIVETSKSTLKEPTNGFKDVDKTGAVKPVKNDVKAKK